MRWMVTGGAGFVGANLVAALLADGAPGDAEQVLVLDAFLSTDRARALSSPPLGGAARLGPGDAPWRPGRRLAVLEGDIRDPGAVARATEGADIVVHLAANTGVAPSVADPRLDCEMNVVGTLNCLEAARASGVGRFVFASSGAPAGLCAPPVTEATAPRPASPYGASKLAGEAYCSAYANAFGLPTVALRFSNVYGPGSLHKGSVVATFLRAALDGRPVVVNGDGGQTRDFVHVADLVRAVRLAATAPGLGGELFQIATGRETSVNELLALIGAALGRRGLPAPTVTRGERSAADVPRSYADSSKAARLLGWTPAIGLEHGIEATLDWFLGRRAA